jgi:hypothetical protein
MARFFFHLIDSVDILLDEEGIELSREAIAANALRQARSIIADDACRGRIDLHYRIDVKDEQGTLVHSLPFSNAVEIAA